MSYLAKYDQIPNDQPLQKVGLVTGWLATDWRPFFAELRENRPILQTPAFTLAALFSDVTDILTHHQVFSVRLYESKMDPVVDGPFMLARDDAPANWREKSIMRAMLCPEDLPAVREMSGALADEALDRCAAAGQIEVVSQLGRYVPLRVCGDYFGFPGPDLPTMYRWSRATQADMFKNLQNDPAVHAAAVQAGHEMMAYLQELLDQKSLDAADVLDDMPEDAPPAPDVFSRLIQTQFPAEIGFDTHRMLANMAGLLIGSGETTSQAIVQALQQLLSRPDVAPDAIKAAGEADPARFDAMVWEALRFNPINPLLFRFCERDYPLAAGTPHETVIKAGTVVFACTASAMFDPAAFPDPENFHPDRPDYNRMHFGYGHHTCLGEYVGRMEIPEVIRRVLRRPNVRLLPPPAGAIDFKGGPFPESFTIGFG